MHFIFLLIPYFYANISIQSGLYKMAPYALEGFTSYLQTKTFLKE